MQPNERREGAIAAPLLTYSLTTDPMPVQVSLSATSLSTATLTFVVSCPKKTSTFPGAATVAAIEIVLPVDTGGIEDPANLCLTAPLESDVSISSSNKYEVWQASPAGAPGAFYFMLQNEEPVLVSEQSLTIEFRNIEINTLVGTALVTINEWAVPGSGTPTTPDDGPPSGQQLVAVAKFPYGFYASNFTSDTPTVKNGDEPPVLSWMGSSNATYLMLYESNSVDVSDVQSWSPPNSLTQMTTFILQVSAQQGNQTATMDFNLTIEVENPSLTAQDLTVLTTSTLNGPVNVGASGAPANLVVNGDVQAGKNLTVTGPLTANAAANVVGALNVIGGVSFGNNLNVAGPATFDGGLTANNGLTVNNGLTARGVVSMFGSPPQQLGTGTAVNYQAGSDGLLVGVVYPTSTTTAYYNLTIFAKSSTLTARATGGGTLQTNANSTNYQLVQSSNMFTLPVLNGDVVTLGYVTPLTNPKKLPLPSYAFYWFPFGNGSLTPVVATNKKSRKPAGKKKPAKKRGNLI